MLHWKKRISDTCTMRTVYKSISAKHDCRSWLRQQSPCRVDMLPSVQLYATRTVQRRWAEQVEQWWIEHGIEGGLIVTQSETIGEEPTPWYIKNLNSSQEHQSITDCGTASPSRTPWWTGSRVKTPDIKIHGWVFLSFTGQSTSGNWSHGICRPIGIQVSIYSQIYRIIHTCNICTNLRCTCYTAPEIRHLGSSTPIPLTCCFTQLVMWSLNTDIST